MKFLCTLFFILYTLPQNNIDSIRKLYTEASNDEKKTLELYQITEKKSKGKGIIYKGYYGAALTLKAKYAKKRKDKISFFKEGAQLIENAIKKDSTNIELRFIRLSIQEHAPKITRYKKNIEEDRNFITTNLKKITSHKLKKYIKEYLSK